jgi:hypothetical protein
MKIDAVEVLNEGDHIAAGIALPAKPQLLFHINREPIVAFAAPGTGADPLSPTPAKPNHSARDLVFDQDLAGSIPKRFIDLWHNPTPWSFAGVGLEQRCCIH